MVRVRFHGRGGQGAKTASRILGEAAFSQGLDVQDAPVYGAERRGAPVVAFTRISDDEILERGFIFDPDVVIVMDETLLKDSIADPFNGIRSGGLLFVNTSRSPSEIECERKDIKVVTYDLVGSALKVFGKSILSAASAAVAARLISIISEEALIHAVTMELADIGVAGELVQKNLQLASIVYRAISPEMLDTTEHPMERRLMPFSVTVTGNGLEDITAVGNSRLRHTGNWRIFMPTINYEKCTACMVCYAYCPESAMTLGADGKPIIDYENCKGCLICYRECPPKAVTIEREVKAL
jgi:pyruvate ferredoxin oxidoreductase gamma subunit